MFNKSTSIFTLFIIILSSCTLFPPKIPEQSLASTWADMTLRITRFTPANSPTFASRGLGYIGLTMYETIVHGSPEYQSIAAHLNDLNGLPLPEKGVVYDWNLALNAGQAFIIKSIYQQTSEANKNSIDSLENVFFTHFSKQQPQKVVIQRSIDYGRSVANAIFEWSKTDGGHRGYLQNFDKNYEHPKHFGGWRPPMYAQSFSHHPLHPYWGKNRTFLKENAQIATPPMIPCDTNKTSVYYQQYLEVYEKEKVLTLDEKEAALWWGDDPSETFTPPGHSYYLANTALKKVNPPLIVWAETFARVGMSVADAFIDCWKWKYFYFSERPNTFIPQYIDQEWESFWPDPPFPAFPSGHAIQSAAAATVLTDLLCEPFDFVDNAHVGRPRDGLRNVEFKARTYHSFWQVAEETANSRFFGGIHTRQDNQAGQDAGVLIGKNVNALPWKK
jgi:PAP2 superfamily